MKKIISILIVFIITQHSFTQSINDLDQKKGFKEFSLGDNLSKWDNQISRKGSWDDGSVGYLYSGNCCNKLFDYDIDTILLRFYKNLLVGIYITTEKFQKSYDESGKLTDWRSTDFERIKDLFSILFDTPTGLDKSDMGNITYIWMGKKVFLKSTYEFLGTYEGDRVVVSIEDIDFLMNKLKSGF